MKFEFDHKTGMMGPKKDEEIYFAKSQGGGLIVDDKKNDIKYIIERDERITKLFGSFDKDNLNLYDMRDARIIADRVRRLLGVDHKYTDFHYFLRGYKMSESFIKTCSDFLGESIWSDMQDRSNGTVRKEDGRSIGHFEDGTNLVMPNDAWADGGELVEFDEGNIYTFDESGDKIYVAVIENPQYRDVYYRYDEESEDVVNMIKCFEADDDLRKNNDFGALKALMRQDEWDDDDFDYLNVEVLQDFVKIKIGQSSYEFAIYEDRNKAINFAIDWEQDLLESDNFTKDVVTIFRNTFGDDFLDEKSMESELKESMESYYNDLDEDDAIEELLRYNVIEDTEEYFGLDEDGDIDHSIQKFDYQDYGDAYAEKYIENIGDVIDEFLSNFGYDGIEDFIKYDRLAQLIIEADGPESAIARYDGVEREETVNGQTYYIYRVD